MKKIPLQRIAELFCTLKDMQHSVSEKKTVLKLLKTSLASNKIRWRTEALCWLPFHSDSLKSISIFKCLGEPILFSIIHEASYKLLVRFKGCTLRLCLFWPTVPFLTWISKYLESREDMRILLCGLQQSRSLNKKAFSVQINDQPLYSTSNNYGVKMFNSELRKGLSEASLQV